MPSFVVASFEIELFNTRNQRGALRALRLRGPEHDPVEVVLWCMAGEPRPRVEAVEEEEGAAPRRWEASFPNGHFEAVVDLLRNEPAVEVTIEPPELLTLAVRR